MRPSDCIHCAAFPCADVRHESFVVPKVDAAPAAISIVMISEAAPANPGDFYFGGEFSLYDSTTLQAFQDAGAAVQSMRDILGLGVYLTAAVKCAKTGYGIATGTVKECSGLITPSRKSTKEGA